MIHTLESWDTHWTHTSKAWDTVGYHNYNFWDTLYLQDCTGLLNPRFFFNVESCFFWGGSDQDELA